MELFDIIKCIINISRWIRNITKCIDNINEWISYIIIYFGISYIINSFSNITNSSIIINNLFSYITIPLSNIINCITNIRKINLLYRYMY